METPGLGTGQEPAVGPGKGKRRSRAKYATEEERTAAKLAGAARGRANQEKGADGRIKAKAKPFVASPAEPAPEVVDEPLRDNTDDLLVLIDEAMQNGVRPEVERVLRLRRRILEACRGNPKKQAAMRSLCSRSIVAYVTWMVWQFNPLRKGREVEPFVLWDFQERALLDSPEETGRQGLVWAYDKCKSLVIEKSREMGASWLLLILCDWTCRFKRRQTWLCISRDQAAVDLSDDENSLFWKLDHIQEHLPSWLAGHRRRGKERKTNRIRYPETRSTITGQASTGKAGVGGRASAMLIDEFSKIDEDRKVRNRTASTASTRYFNGTHEGTNKEFYKLTRTPEIPKLVMHWSQHPDKNKGLYSYDQANHKLRFWEYVPNVGIVELRGPKIEYGGGYVFIQDGTPTGGLHPGLRSPWYDEKCKEIGGPRAIAEELDIDPSGSTNRPFESGMIHDLRVHCRPPLWEGDVEVERDGTLSRFVEGRGGPLKLWVRTEREPQGVFGCGNDIGGGTGATLSVCSVGNCATGEKAARYSSANLSPEVFALVVAALCRWFGNAKAAWEHHGPGVQFGKALMRDAEYRNVFVGKPEDKLKRGARVVTTGPGWRPMGGNKNLLLLDYIRALSNRLFLNYDEEALLDTLEFRYDASGKMVHSQDDGRDPEVARENHGDLTIADALCWKMIDGGGQLVATKKPEVPPEELPQWSVLTWEGRRRLHEARQRWEEEWN